MAETIDDLDKLIAAAEIFADTLRQIIKDHHIIDKTSNDRDDMSEVCYLLDGLESGIADGIVPLRALQNQDDQDDDDDGDFRFRMSRDDAHEQRVV